MMADITILHESDFYRIVNYKCHCDVCSLSDAEYNESFCVSFIRKGFFEYRTFKKEHEVHVGRVLLSKPEYEHITKHIDNQPDITTVFEFKLSFFREICMQYKKTAGWFLLNNDIHSLLLSSNPELEYLHYMMLEKINKVTGNKLETDELVMELLEKVFGVVGNEDAPAPIPDNLIKHHLVTAESAKEYLLTHFSENISLQQVARHCCISPFHFSRIFKTIFKIAPHQFLGEVRLNHAKVLLASTSKPITDIAYNCGFNSIEHFATAFRQRYKISPSCHRIQML
jgi:AraC family transcriptional regulator